jgi:hypothetical protein
MCELPTDLEQRFETLRSKLDECETKTREIFERCKQHNPGSQHHESSSIMTSGCGEEYDGNAKPISVSRVLMIHEEHLSRILSGLKTEEIRSKSCTLGWTALCAGGVIQAITQVLHCTEERDAIAYLLSWESWRRHRIGSDASGRAPSAAALRSSIAAFLAELGVDSRGEYYLKYWRRPLSATRIFRWSLGPVYRVPPTRIAAAGGRTWVRLDPRISVSICENLRHACCLPSPALDGQSPPPSPPPPPPQSSASGGNGGGLYCGGGPLTVASRFFTAHRLQSELGGSGAGAGAGAGWLGSGARSGGADAADPSVAAEQFVTESPTGNSNWGVTSPESESAGSQDECAEASEVAGWLSAFVEPDGSAARKRLRIG